MHHVLAKKTQKTKNELLDDKMLDLKIACENNTSFIKDIEYQSL